MDNKFVAAVQRMEKRTARVRAYVIANGADYAGRIVISCPADGAGRVHAVAWLPGDTKNGLVQHHSSAGGYGYDKATAAMGGARFWNKVKGEWDTLKDQGHDYRWQLETAGYQVFQAC